MWRGIPKRDLNLGSLGWFGSVSSVLSFGSLPFRMDRLEVDEERLAARTQRAGQ
jgi:hypothetical protein